MHRCDAWINQDQWVILTGQVLYESPCDKMTSKMLVILQDKGRIMNRLGS